MNPQYEDLNEFDLELQNRIQQTLDAKLYDQFVNLVIENQEQFDFELSSENIPSYDNLSSASTSYIPQQTLIRVGAPPQQTMPYNLMNIGAGAVHQINQTIPQNLLITQNPNPNLRLQMNQYPLGPQPTNPMVNFNAPGPIPPPLNNFTAPGQTPPPLNNFTDPGQIPPPLNNFTALGQAPPPLNNFAVPGQIPPPLNIQQPPNIIPNVNPGSNSVITVKIQLK